LPPFFCCPAFLCKAELLETANFFRANAGPGYPLFRVSALHSEKQLGFGKLNQRIFSERLWRSSYP